MIRTIHGNQLKSADSKKPATMATGGFCLISDIASTATQRVNAGEGDFVPPHCLDALSITEVKHECK